MIEYHFVRDADVVAAERRRAFNPVALGEGFFAERDRRGIHVLVRHALISVRDFFNNYVRLTS